MQGNNEFDYAKIDDDVAESIRDEMVQEKGFFIKCQLNCLIIYY